MPAPQQYWVKSWMIEWSSRIVLCHIAFDPGGVARSILLEM